MVQTLGAGQKMIEGEKILLNLYKETDRDQMFIKYNGARIKRLLLKTCSRYYKLALQKYFGDIVLRRLEEKNPKDIRGLFILDKNGLTNDSEWLDLSGLLCSQSRVDNLIKEIEGEQISDLDALHSALGVIYKSYRSDEWNWFIKNYLEIYGKDINELSNEDLMSFFEDWKKASLKLLNMVTADAKKEFDSIAKIGFGIDGDKEEDFKAVRDNFKDNSFIHSLQRSANDVEKKFDRITTFINQKK